MLFREGFIHNPLEVLLGDEDDIDSVYDEDLATDAPLLIIRRAIGDDDTADSTDSEVDDSEEEESDDMDDDDDYNPSDGTEDIDDKVYEEDVTEVESST